jgi:hypothetical protein
VTHNCPLELILSVTFGLSVETVADDAFIVHDEDTPEADVTNDGVQEIVVYAKHEAGEGTDQDFGVWHPKLDGEPSFTYTYTVNYAEGAGTEGADNRVVIRLPEHEYVLEYSQCA